MHWYVEVFRKYADFSGRARRAEFWYFQLWNLIIAMVLLALASVMALPGKGAPASPLIMLYGFYCLATILPSLAVAVRRLHDIGKSGWWIFISFIPVIGAVLLIIYNCTDSQPGPNQYGPNPKEVATAAAPA